MAGGLYAHYMMYLNPQMFMFVKSFEVVAMVVLGGLGSISGSIVAAIILTFLPEGLRSVKDYMPGGRDPRMVIYSIMLIVLMLTRPQGLLGRREICGRCCAGARTPCLQTPTKKRRRQARRRERPAGALMAEREPLCSTRATSPSASAA